MSFLVFLFFILLLLLVFPAILLQKAVGWWRRFTGHDIQSEASRYYSGNARQRYEEPSHFSRRRKKVFDRSEGEYVEFEEILENRVEPSGSVTYETEEQVSDAEWTEIK